MDDMELAQAKAGIFKALGHPVRLMIDMQGDHDVVALHIYQPGQYLIVASDAGRGFIVNTDDLVAQTKNGKQILNLGVGEEAATARFVPEDADHIAVIGTNHKLLIFDIEELPEMARGRGNIMQRYKKGAGAVLRDVKAFCLEDGLSYPYAGGERVEPKKEIKKWIGKRAGAGLKAPRGFPTSNRFS